MSAAQGQLPRESGEGELTALEARCPAVLLAAPSSGQGKTTLTAGLARHHVRQGRRVRVFKTGPDFIDPSFLERASGQPVHNLDLWMVGEARCRHLLARAATEADLILIEGVMGLYDGFPSSADIAQRLGVPVLLVIDAWAMAETFGAVALGLSSYRAGIPFAGVVANRVAGEAHAVMLRGSVPPDLPFRGAVPAEPAVTIPDRHLGLVQAQEVSNLERVLERAADRVGRALEGWLPAPVVLNATVPPSPPPLLDGVRIGVARDEAFAFIYPDNLELLQAMGAGLRFFSPLRDTALPEVDAVYLPGGYPELHLERLATNTGLRAGLRQHHRAGKPLYAECGGMLYLLEYLTDGQGRQGRMAGLLPGTAVMEDGLMGLGMQAAPVAGGWLRGHSFHHSRMSTSLMPEAHGRRYPDGSAGEAIYRRGSLTASYLHLYFPSDPAAAASLFLPG